MTAHDIIKIAFANEYENIESDQSAANHSIEVLNTLLVDCFSAEQNSRERDGKEPLAEVPYLTAMTDEVPYNLMFLRYVLPYGLEWKYAEQNLDQARADQYRILYEDAKMRAGGGVWL